MSNVSFKGQYGVDLAQAARRYRGQVFEKNSKISKEVMGALKDACNEVSLHDAKGFKSAKPLTNEAMYKMYELPSKSIFKDYSPKNALVSTLDDTRDSLTRAIMDQEDYGVLKYLVKNFKEVNTRRK